MSLVRSRPLRFLMSVVGGWTALRVAMLWPEAVLAPVSIAAPAAVRSGTATPVVSGRGHPRSVVLRRNVHRAARDRPPPRVTAAPRVAAAPIAVAAADRLADRPLRTAGEPSWPGIFRPPDSPRASRWSASAWLIVRPGGTATPFTPQLGGSQAGVRVAYALDRARRLALAARVSGALGNREREASIGIDWRPTALPIRVVAEQRIGLTGQRDGAALGVISGIDPAPVAAGFTIEAYGQAGAIRRAGVELYADGAARAIHPLGAVGGVRLTAGAGAWGGAQRGAARLDVGPTLGVAIPLARRQLRLTLDWRQRVAGNARPASGPAVSLGTDF